MLDSAAVPDRLIGRDEELLRLRTFLDEARSHSTTLLVTGEPGIGKSSLLGVAREIAHEQGATVLQATGGQFEVEVGFAGLHQLLAPFAHAFPALDPRHRETLETCLGVSTGPPPGRSTIAAATVALLAHLAADSAVLVVVDDAPWLDRPTASVLVTVSGSLAELPAGFLMALRE